MKSNITTKKHNEKKSAKYSLLKNNDFYNDKNSVKNTSLLGHKTKKR